MKNSIAFDLVQKSELSNRIWFTKLVENLSYDDFQKFCNEIMFLREYYDSTVGLYATDKVEVQILHPDLVWQLEEIDFNGEVNFKKIS